MWKNTETHDDTRGYCAAASADCDVTDVDGTPGSGRGMWYVWEMPEYGLTRVYCGIHHQQQADSVSAYHDAQRV